MKESALKNYNYDFGNNLVSTFITSFYDAVILYSLAVNETLSDNDSIVNGNDVIKRMWNRTFDGITGKVYINENGDRDADYSLLDMNPLTSRFEVCENVNLSPYMICKKKNKGKGRVESGCTRREFESRQRTNKKIPTVRA